MSRTKAKDEMENQEAELLIPQEVAILPSGETVIYPEMMIPLAAGEEKMVKLIDDVLSSDKILGLFAQRSGGEGSSADNIYNVGTATAVARMFKMPDGSIRAFLQGMKRIKIKKIIQTEPYIRAQIKVVEEKFDKTPELEALTFTRGDWNCSNKYCRARQACRLCCSSYQPYFGRKTGDIGGAQCPEALKKGNGFHQSGTGDSGARQ
jgi:ATP-dependent Lon protease